MITFIYGPNAYRRTEALATITADVPAETIERYDGETMTAQQLADVLQGQTLFASQKLVVVRDLSLNKALWESLAEQISAVPYETHLVLIELAPDKRLRTFKALQKNATVIVCNELHEADLVTWIQTRAKTANKVIDRQLAQLIIERVGPEQQRLQQEVDKVLLVPDQLSAALITDLIDVNDRGDVFALLDGVLQRRADLVRSHLAQLKPVEEPYRLYGLLASQVFSLSLVWAGQKLSPETLAKQTGLHPFLIRKLSAVVRGMPRSELTGLVRELAKLDDQLKSSPLDAWELLELSLSRLASR